MIKKVNHNLISSVLPLVKDFVEESDWNWSFNDRHSVRTFLSYIENEDTEVLITCENDKPTGFAFIAYDEDFQNERVGYISKFYIAKEARGTGAGRELIDAVCTWFDFNQCVDSFATATANIKGEGKAFKNLLAKVGYIDCGETLVRKK